MKTINLPLIIVFGFYVMLTNYIIVGYENQLDYSDKVLNYVSNKCFSLSEGDDMTRKYK